MASLSAQELQGRAEKDLHDLIQKERARLRDLRFRLAGAQLKNVQQITEAKKNIARALTILHSRKKDA